MIYVPSKDKVYVFLLPGSVILDQILGTSRARVGMLSDVRAADM